VSIIILQGIISAARNTSLTKEQDHNWKYFALIVALHIIQPMARLQGRLKHGLTPWRIRGARANLKNLTFFKPKILVFWSEGNWKSVDAWLEQIEQNIVGLKARVKRGGDFDRWDIQTRNGLFSTVKGILTIEEHGAKKQYLKFRYTANYSLSGLVLIVLFGFIAAQALINGSLVVAGILSIFTIVITGKYVLDSASVVNCMVTGFKKLSSVVEKEPGLKIADVNQHPIITYTSQTRYPKVEAEAEEMKRAE
jgi:hypothetical protein